VPKSKEPIVISFYTNEFYDKILELVKAAGAYASAVKLHENLEDEATAWKVQGVLTRYYEGDMGILRDTIHFRRRECGKIIRELNTLNRNNGIREIIKPDSLINLLLDEIRRRKYVQLANKHRKKDEIVDLRVIESEFRDWRAKKK